MSIINIPRGGRKYNPCLSSAVNKIISLASVTACAHPLTKEVAHTDGRGFHTGKMGTKDSYTTPTVRSTASSDTESDDDVHRVEPQRYARAYDGVGGRVQFVDDAAEWISCRPRDLVEVRE